MVESYDSTELYKLASATFSRKSNRIPFSYEVLERIVIACKQNNACKMYFVRDERGGNIAGVLFVYDKETVYYLVGGMNFVGKELGVKTLLVYKGIEFALETG